MTKVAFLLFFLGFLLISCGKKKEPVVEQPKQEAPAVQPVETKPPEPVKQVAAEPPKAEKGYTVKRGDTFSEICQEITGCGQVRCWKEEASRLGLSNPDLIHPDDRYTF